jgi:hypothetical protein
LRSVLKGRALGVAFLLSPFSPQFLVPERKGTFMIDLQAISTQEILKLHVNMLAELRRRDVVRGANNPVGDYAEMLFARAFGWSLLGKVAAGADACDSEGKRYQVKCRRLATPKGVRSLGFIRRLPEQPFDYLAAVLLDNEFNVLRGAIVPLVLSSNKRDM